MYSDYNAIIIDSNKQCFRHDLLFVYTETGSKRTATFPVLCINDKIELKLMFMQIPIVLNSASSYAINDSNHQHILFFKKFLEFPFGLHNIWHQQNYNVKSMKIWFLEAPESIKNSNICISQHILSSSAVTSYLHYKTVTVYGTSLCISTKSESQEKSQCFVSSCCASMCDTRCK